MSVHPAAYGMRAAPTPVSTSFVRACGDTPSRQHAPRECGDTKPGDTPHAHAEAPTPMPYMGYGPNPARWHERQLERCMDKWRHHRLPTRRIVTPAATLPPACPTHKMIRNGPPARRRLTRRHHRLPPRRRHKQSRSRLPARRTRTPAPTPPPIRSPHAHAPAPHHPPPTHPMHERRSARGTHQRSRNRQPTSPTHKVPIAVQHAAQIRKHHRRLARRTDLSPSASTTWADAESPPPADTPSRLRSSPPSPPPPALQPTWVGRSTAVSVGPSMSTCARCTAHVGCNTPPPPTTSHPRAPWASW
jgi:hypothetical protein